MALKNNQVTYFRFYLEKYFHYYYGHSVISIFLILAVVTIKHTYKWNHVYII